MPLGLLGGSLLAVFAKRLFFSATQRVNTDSIRKSRSMPHSGGGKGSVCFALQLMNIKDRATLSRPAKPGQSLRRYLLNSRFLVLLTAPMIWMCLIPIVLADIVGTIYQAVCFPIYGIPKVHRRDYLSFDRHRLTYLNFVEKLNCEYCAYANGILAYFTEIAARTEQHFCPVKHERCVKCPHSRYKNFVDFGDAEKDRQHLEEIRRSFQDVESGKTYTKKP